MLDWLSLSVFATGCIISPEENLIKLSCFASSTIWEPAWIDAIQETYGAQLPRVDPGDFGTVTLSNEVN